MPLRSITPLINTLVGDVSSSSGDTAEQDGTLKLASALADGVDYLVIWRAGLGHNDNAAVAEASLKFGPSGDLTGSVLGFTSSECTESSFTPASAGGMPLQGFTIITGNGSDIVKATFRCVTASDQAFFGSGYLIAIPLDYLVEGRDYFFRGNDEAGGVAATGEGQRANAATGAFETIDTIAWDFPGNQEWICGMCVEGKPGDGGNNESARVRFTIGGTQFGDCGGGDPFKVEWEDDADWFNFVWWGVRTLTGNVTFLAEGRSENAAESDYRRCRFIALRKNFFQQVVSLVNTTGVAANNASYTNFLSQAYTPAQEEYVLALSALVGKSLSFARRYKVRLRNDTAGTDLLNDASCGENNGASGDGNDMHPIQLIGATQISGATTFTVDQMRIGGNGNIRIGQSDDGALGIESNLILIGLTEADQGGVRQPLRSGGVIPVF